MCRNSSANFFFNLFTIAELFIARSFGKKLTKHLAGIRYREISVKYKSRAKNESREEDLIETK